MWLWLRKDFRIRLVRERKSIIGKGGFLIAYLKTSFRIFSSYALNWKSQLKYGSKKENRLIRRLLQGLTVGVLPIGIANRKLYPISFPWEKQWILYDLQFILTTGPCCITQDNLKLFLSVSHVIDQQTLKGPLWEIMPVEGQGHSLIHWISPCPVVLAAHSFQHVMFSRDPARLWKENLTLRLGASLVAQAVKRLPAVRETQVRSPGWEEALEKQMATPSSILAWKTPWTEEPGRLPSMGLQRVRHDWATSLHVTSRLGADSTRSQSGLRGHSESRGLLGIPWKPGKNLSDSLTFHRRETNVAKSWGGGRSSCPGATFLKPALSWARSWRSSLHQGWREQSLGLKFLCAQSLSCVRLFATPWTVARQAPLSMGFSGQEDWSGLPCPPPGELPSPGIEPASPAVAGKFFTTKPPVKYWTWTTWAQNPALLFFPWDPVVSIYICKMGITIAPTS